MRHFPDCRLNKNPDCRNKNPDYDATLAWAEPLSPRDSIALAFASALVAAGEMPLTVRNQGVNLAPPQWTTEMMKLAYDLADAFLIERRQQAPR